MLACNDLLVEFFDEWDTPATAGACGKAGTDLAGEFWSLALAEVHDLALRDVKTQAYMVIWIHDIILGQGGMMSPLTKPFDWLD